jgi:hypothetical protein
LLDFAEIGLAEIESQHFFFKAGNEIRVVLVYGEEVEKVMMNENVESACALLQSWIEDFNRRSIGFGETGK